MVVFRQRMRWTEKNKKNALSAVDTGKAFSEDEGARTLNLRIDSPML